MRLFLSPPHLTGHEARLFQQALDSRYIAPAGPQLDRLEQELAPLLGMREVLALNSATAALHLAIRHLLSLLPPSQDPRPPVVLASSLTFIASIAPALQSGCEVWLIDAEQESWTLDPILLSHALDRARADNRRVLCLIPTDLYGQCCDLDALHGLCAPRGIPILLDAAESLGALFHGRARPWASVTSFNGNKILTCSAGGALASDDPHLIAHARKLSQQAREPLPHYEHRELGHNYRLSNLLAAVALAQLPALHDRVQSRRRIFARYQQRLQGLPGLSWMPEAPWNTPTRWLSVLRLSPDSGLLPEHLRLALEAADIESRPVWKPMHLQPVLRGLPFFGQGVSDQLFAQGLCLPSGSAMSDHDVDRVADIIRTQFDHA